VRRPALKGGRLAAALVAALALASNAFAQGKSTQSHGKGKAPSSTSLPAPTAIAAPSGATPFAWIEDASLVEPHSVWVGFSTLRWQGSGLSEVSIPIIDVAVGLAPRLQVGANIPRAVDRTDQGGGPGGLGTTYFNAKIGVSQSERIKLAVAPTMEVLPSSAVEGSDVSRVQWGLPVSIEADRGRGSVYGGTGYFSRGVWYAGGGLAVQINDRLVASGSFSRAWASTATDDPTLAGPSRNELSAGASYALTPTVGVFGSIGSTIATAEENGAGTTFSIGLSVAFRPVLTTK